VCAGCAKSSAALELLRLTEQTADLRVSRRGRGKPVQGNSTPESKVPLCRTVLVLLRCSIGVEPVHLGGRAWSRASGNISSIAASSCVRVFPWITLTFESCATSQVGIEVVPGTACLQD
jgi:hypothetical protein